MKLYSSTKCDLGCKKTQHDTPYESMSYSQASLYLLWPNTYTEEICETTLTKQNSLFLCNMAYCWTVPYPLCSIHEKHLAWCQEVSVLSHSWTEIPFPFLKSSDNRPFSGRGAHRDSPRGICWRRRSKDWTDRHSSDIFYHSKPRGIPLSWCPGDSVWSDSPSLPVSVRRNPTEPRIVPRIRCCQESQYSNLQFS